MPKKENLTHVSGNSIKIISMRLRENECDSESETYYFFYGNWSWSADNQYQKVSKQDKQQKWLQRGCSCVCFVCLGLAAQLSKKLGCLLSNQGKQQQGNSIPIALFGGGMVKVVMVYVCV